LSRVFSFEDVGRYSYFLALITPLHLFFGLQLRNFFNSTHGEINLDDIFGIRLITSTIFILFTLIIGLIFINGTDVAAFSIIIFAKCFESFSEISHAQKQRDGDIRYIGLILLAKSLIMCLMALGSVYLFKTFYSLLIAVLIPSILFAIIDLWNIKDKLNIKRKLDKRILYATLPLALSALVTSANINIPRYLLEHFYGMKLVGIFTTVFFFYAIVLIIANSLIQAILNKISESSKDKISYQKTILQFLKALTVITFCLVLGNSLFGPAIYQLAYGDNYKDHYHLLTHLNYLIPLGLLATKLGYMIMAQNDYKSLLYASVTSSVIHFILSLYLIQSYYIQGAFYALAISLIINIILNTIQVLKRAGIIEWKVKHTSY